MKLKAIAAVVSLLVLGSARAQEDAYNLVNLHPSSPTAFQFQKYTEMPVSEYTGIPEISVPLYEINVDGLKLPVNLTYHSRGNNVTQEASWVGLGWDLQMGSLIQTINDRDDYGSDPVGPIVKQLPDYFPSNGDGSPVQLPLYQLDPVIGSHGAGWTSPYPINQPQAMQGYAVATSYYIPVNGQFSVQQSGLFTQRWYDSEPDFFVANFPEGPIKFILDFNNPGRIAVLNKLGYLVKKTSGGFRVTAPTGNSYYFETESSILNVTSGQSMEGYTSPYLTGGDTVSRIFFLSRIVTKNKKQISFQYATTPASYNGYPVQSQELQSLVSEGTNTFAPPPGGNGNYDFATFNPIGDTYWFGQGTYSTTSYNIEQYFFLQAIVFPTGRLDFYTSNRSDINGSEKLDSVRISDANGNRVKTWQLDYSYFNSTSVGGNGYGDTNGGTLSSDSLSLLRLELLDVREVGSGGAVYKFNYNPTLLPKKNSYAVDYWGFYNGALTNSSLVPDPTQVGVPSLGDNGNNKNANGTYAQACMLQSIQYPTGGKVTFEYELNQLNTSQMTGLQPTNSNIQGGGLRIHAVNHLNSDGRQAMRTAYTYGTGRQIDFKPVLQQMPYILFNLATQTAMYTVTYTLTQISVNGVFGTNPMASITGVGYDMVTRQEVDSLGNSIGSTVTTFNNNVDLHNPTIYSRVLHCGIPTVRSINTPENGSIATVTKYDSKGNMVEDLSNTYQLSPSEIFYGARILPYGNLYYEYTMDGVTNTETMPQNLVGYFPIYDVQTLLSRTNDTVFYANGPMPSDTYYGYDNYNQMDSKSSDRSDGGTENTIYYYPYSPTSTLPIFQTMVDSNRLADIVTLQKETNYTTLKYQYDRSFEQKGGLILESKAVIQNNPIPHGSPNFPDTITYDVYDPSNANILQYTAKGMTNAVIWDYGKNYIVAEVKNAAYSQVAYSSFEAGGTGNWTFVGAATADTTAPTGSMCYNLGQSGGNISSPTLNSDSSYIVSYWIKGGGSLNIPGTLAGYPIQGKTIKGWTYFEHKVTGQSALTISGSTYIDELRLYPATAQMTTYTVKPLVGTTSECDVANRITYYFYDNLGRLSYQKDQDGNIVKTYQYHYQGQ